MHPFNVGDIIRYKANRSTSAGIRGNSGTRFRVTKIVGNDTIKAVHIAGKASHLSGPTIDGSVELNLYASAFTLDTKTENFSIWW